MQRKTISFAIPQIEKLANKAKSLGISIAELVRRAVDAYIP